VTIEAARKNTDFSPKELNMRLKYLSNLALLSTALVLTVIGSCFAGSGGGCISAGPSSMPEPAALSLLGAGVGAIVAYRWLKSKR